MNEKTHKIRSIERLRGSVTLVSARRYMLANNRYKVVVVADIWASGNANDIKLHSCKRNVSSEFVLLLVVLVMMKLMMQVKLLATDV